MKAPRPRTPTEATFILLDAAPLEWLELDEPVFVPDELADAEADADEPWADL